LIILKEYKYYDYIMERGVILNPTRIQITKIVNAITKGRKWHHVRFINWSYLTLGKLALTQIKIKIIIFVFKPRINPDNKPRDSKPKNE
jgi:hypothetical protein